jgi:hypothetical protein
MVKPQFIYKAKDFIFENNSNPAPKYFIVFHQDEEYVVLFSLTISKSKLPEELDLPNSSGCVFFNDNRGYGHSYIIPEGKVIGSNNFNFPQKTYIQIEIRAQLKEIDVDLLKGKFVTQKLIECCFIIDSEFQKIVECLLKSKFLKNKHKKQIENKYFAI